LQRISCLKRTSNLKSKSFLKAEAELITGQ
jgi:hypothetical protein